MKKFFSSLGRFTTKLVSLLVICGLISLACLPMVYAMQGNARSDTDYGDCEPEETPEEDIPEAIADTAEGDEPTDGGKGEEDDDDGQTETYKITIQYCADGKKISQDKTDTAEAGKSYHLIAKEIEGYTLLDDLEQLTKVITRDTLFTIHYQRIIVSATLIIHYVYDDGTPEEIHTADYAVGEEYKVDTPTKDGYTYDKAVIEGVMEKGGAEYTVTYTKNAPDQPDPVVYTITVKYQDTSGETISDYTTEKCEANKECTITPKQIEGYIALNDELKEIFTEDTTVIFKYEKSVAKATLTINYVFKDGEGGDVKAPDPYVEEYEVGQAYAVESPKVANYTPNQDSVTGTMIAGGVTVTVIYAKNSPDTPTEHTITIHCEDADTKKIIETYTEVRTAGEHTLKFKKIDGYITPEDQIINVSVDTSITVTYKKIPTSNPEQPGDDDDSDDDDKTTPTDPTDPTTPDDPENPTDSDEKPGTQQPSEQKPSNQSPITLPTAGASDDVIRNFLILDAEVSAGGVGLWAISGVIRKIRRR